MYVPTHFKQEEVPELHDAIRRISFATLVTFGSEGIEGSHVPMLLDPEPAPFGTLLGHLARANPQWRRAAEGVEALAVFLGPDAYVTPSWYPTKRQTGKVVPTWNYVAVHAYGTVRFLQDRERLRALVTLLTRAHEARRPEPWAVSDAPAPFVDAMLGAIVGFELPIARLEGKWKLSQNRPAEDRAGVVDGLTHDGNGGEGTVADIMAAMIRPGAGTGSAPEGR